MPLRKQRGLGRRPHVDDRDQAYPMRAVLAPTVEARTYRYWNMNGAWLDQGQTGTCFKAGTPVVMADGSERAIEDVRAGEYVMSAQGVARMVESVMARHYQGELVRMTVQGRYDFIEATPEHPFQSADGWTPAKDVSVVRMPKLSIDVPNETLDLLDVLPDAESTEETIRTWGARGAIPRFMNVTPALGRLIGLYAAEGHAATKGGRITFTFHENESDYIAEVGKMLAETFGVETYVQHRAASHVRRVRAGSATLARVFDALVGRMSYGKRLHPVVWSWSDEVLTGIWDGFADGDGYSDHKAQRLVTVSQDLARDLWRIGLRLGYAPTLRTTLPPTSRLRRQRYDVYRYTGETRYRRHQDETALWANVLTHERVPHDGLVFNLQVETDRSYIANGVAVHNCVGHGWAHEIEDGPVTHPDDVVDPFAIYDLATTLDPWPDNDHDVQAGTSVRAGAKAAKALGYISVYTWAWDVPTIEAALISTGPVVFACDWYRGCDKPTPIDGRPMLTLDGELRGGHCFVLNGVNRIDRVVRMKNSWGQAWADKGHAWIGYEVLEQMLATGGEACLPTDIAA